jgi:tryptophan-rich sensory protein
VALCLGIGALGGAVTATSVEDLVRRARQASFTSARPVFGPVWTALYVLMAIAAWRVWRTADRDTRRGPLTLFALQLALTLGWTVVFFGLQKIGAALATIVVLDVGVAVTTLAFRPIDPLGGAADASLSRLGGLRHGAQHRHLASQPDGLMRRPSVRRGGDGSHRGCSCPRRRRP